MMKLERIAIKNFRSIPPRGVDVFVRDGVTVLLGRNNAGKSNVLEALVLMLGEKNPRYSRPEGSDYYDQTQPIAIEAEFGGLDWEDGKAIGLSDPQCAMLTKRAKAKPEVQPGQLTLRLQIPRYTGEGQEENEEEERTITTIYLANQHEVRRTEEIRRALIRVLNVPAVRKQDELLNPSAWTAYGKLMRELIGDSPRRVELEEVIREATSTLEGILTTEAEELTVVAKLTSYVDRVSFQLTKEGEAAELLRNLVLFVEFDGRLESLDKAGTGTQSAMILAILELCLRHRRTGGVRLYVVEEPELFLHPHAQRRIAILLRELSAETGTQVILTTHSPLIVAGSSPDDVIRVDRGADNGTRCLAVPLDSARDEDRFRVVTPETAEMLFADRVILVEGPSEALLLPRVARVLNAESGDVPDLNKLNVSIVDVGGKDRFASFTRVLDGLKIPWRIIADRDALVGDALQRYKIVADLTGSEAPGEQQRKLRDKGVAVLSDGEIEDYYPLDALAVIGGCSVEDAQEQIAARRKQFGEPTLFRMVERIISDQWDEIATTREQNPDRLPKVLKQSYDRVLDRIQAEGGIETRERRTGDALAAWLDMNKPLIAVRVAEWLEAEKGRVPERFRKLIQWCLEGMD